MTATDGEVVFWQDASSLRAHKRTRVAGSLQAFEADNSDEAGDGAVITAEELAAVPLDRLCHRCFADEILLRTAAGE